MNLHQCLMMFVLTNPSKRCKEQLRLYSSALGMLNRDISRNIRNLGHRASETHQKPRIGIAIPWY